MAYQPPLIGYKKLLNFGAYSIPDIGGWIFIAVGVLLVIALFLELRRTVKITKGLEIKTTMIAVLMTLLLSACSSGPQPIKYGTDGCDFCKMTISDNRFGGELITQKGKAYKFDDLHCLSSFLKSNYIEPAEIGEIYLVDFSRPGTLIVSKESFLLKSEALRSPMGANIAAFKEKDSMTKFSTQYPGEGISWETVKNQ
jgi:copper chaperone NosL